MVSTAVVVLVELLLRLVFMGTCPATANVMLGLWLVVRVTVNNVRIVRPWCTLSSDEVKLFRRVFLSLSEKLVFGRPVAVATALHILTV